MSDEEERTAAREMVYSVRGWGQRSPAFCRTMVGRWTEIIAANVSRPLRTEIASLHAKIADLTRERDTFVQEYHDESAATDKIGEYLVPLVGTADGTAVSSAQKAAEEIKRLRQELIDTRKQRDEMQVVDTALRRENQELREKLSAAGLEADK